MERIQLDLTPENSEILVRFHDWSSKRLILTAMRDYCSLVIYGEEIMLGFNAFHLIIDLLFLKAAMLVGMKMDKLKQLSRVGFSYAFTGSAASIPHPHPPGLTWG